jgi:hypothetical protein
MGGSIISIFEVFYRLLLMAIATFKMLLRLRVKQPRENVVRPWSNKAFAPHHTDIFFPKTRHKNILKSY